MSAIYKLALVTRDRVREVKEALADAFVGKGEFDKEVATEMIGKLADRSAGGDHEEVSRRFHRAGQEWARSSTW